jgi:hypothetical protein
MSARLSLVPGLAAAFALCGTPQQTAFQLGLPGSRIGMTVTRVVPRGPYLEVRLRAPGLELVSYAPADAGCREVLAEEREIVYRSGGTGGSYEREGRQCEAAGIGSLEEWRKRRPQPRTRSPVPSAPASFTSIYEDADVALVRGRFPLAGLLGWVGGSDTIAVIPNTPICQGPLRSGSATLQYFPGGERVLALAAQGGLCPVQGLIAPLPH